MSVSFDDNIRETYLKNVDAEYLLTLENFFGNFSHVFYVNLKKNKIRLLMCFDAYKEVLSAVCQDGYRNYRDFFIKNMVLDSDRGWFEEKTDDEYIKKKLSEEPFYTFTFNMVDKGVAHKELVKVVGYANECDRFIVCSYNLDMKQKYEADYIRHLDDHKNEAIVSTLARDYEIVFYLEDLEQKITTYYVSDRFKGLIDEFGEIDSVDKIGEFFKTHMTTEDGQKFVEKANRKVTFDALNEHPVYDVCIRLTLDEDKQHYVLRCVKDVCNEDGIIVGLRKVDEEVRSQIRREELEQSIKMMEKQLEVTINERTSEIIERTKTLNRVNEDIIEMLGDITEARDIESGEHIRRVKGFTHILATQIMNDWPEYNLTPETVDLMTSASALHDIGKIMIPDAILLKPGRLTKEEFEIMKTHSVNGCEILKKAPRDWSEEYLKISMEICRHHHEKWDGGGYPDGLKGDQIPISAQIVSVADCFDALTTKRVYKDAYEPEYAFNMILNGECGQFSDKLMSSFKYCKDKFISHVNKTVEECMDDLGARNIVGSMTGLKILFVEDNEISREIGRDILEGEGVEVTEVMDGGIAFEMIKTMPPDSFDAILMDVIMPHVSGPDATRAIRSIDRYDAKTIPIIAITSSTSENDVQECIDAGMDALLSKPISIKALTKTLLECLKERSDKYRAKLMEAEKYIGIDQLTGVKNITSYTSTVEELANRIANDKDTHFALLKCDINDLAKVNESGGHNAGNIYIRNCCDTIREVFQNSDLYRIGSDEFLAVVVGEDYDNKEALYKKLRIREAEAEATANLSDGKTAFAFGMEAFDAKIDHSVGDVIKRTSKSMEENKRLMKFRKNTN